MEILKNVVEIIDTYNKEGYLTKRTCNNVPVFVPKQYIPSVQIIHPDTEWITEKLYMTKKEFSERFGEIKLLSDKHKDVE